MLKRVGLVAAAILAAGLTVTSLAYAEDGEDFSGGGSGGVYQHEVQYCDEDYTFPDGELSILSEGIENNSDDDVDCDQENYPEQDD
ncbi:MAG: hypothetical protein ACT4O0_21200 [Pseudonocardia sp.]